MPENDYWSSDAVRAYFVAKRSNERLDLVLRSTAGLQSSVGAVLDVGCGYGRNLVPFAASACELYAFDPCEKALCYTQQRHLMNESHVRVCRLEDEPWRGERKFDFVVCDGVLHQCRDVDTMRRAVEYLKDAVSDDGYVFISAFTSDDAPTGAVHVGGDVWQTDEGVLMTLVRSSVMLQMFNAIGFSCISVWHDTFELDVGTRSNLTVLLRRIVHAH